VLMYTVQVTVVFILCLVGDISCWPPDNISYRGGKAQGGHGGHALASGPEIEDSKARYGEKKSKGHAKHQKGQL